MTSPRLVAAGALAALWIAVLSPVPPGGVRARVPAGYIPVTDDRLREPDPGDWLMYRRTYDGWGYSPLRQINARNVADVAPAWVFATGVENEHHQSPPIVNAGRMFVTTGAHVIALDAADGRLLWRYERTLPGDLRRPHPTNRGVALFDERVYVGTLDAHVVALDAVTGEVVWERAVDDYRDSYYITMAPLVATGRVMVGTSGGEQGVRGSITALDAATGDLVWKRYTVPAPGEPGSETWPGETWRTGGAPVWLTGTYDPEANVAYWGVGNAGPWMGDTRPGDNLYSNSTIAVDVETGELRGHHQYHWNGSWDWDEANAPLLVDVERGGRTIPALVHAGRNGYLWLLERQADRLSFIEGIPFVHQNVFTGLDPLTGRPAYDPARVPGTGRQAEFCPSLSGARNWPPEAYSPQTGYLYVPANENMCSRMEGLAVEYLAGEEYVGADAETFLREGADHVGELQAWDVDTGTMAWNHALPSGTGGSVLTTAGGLVIVAGAELRILNAWTGRLLWRLRTGYERLGVPTTYEVRGVQYIAVQSGTRHPTDDVDPRAAAPRDGLVWVFALDCQC